MSHKLVGLSSAIPLEDTLISERSSPKKYQYHFFKSESAQFDSKKERNPLPLLNLSRFKLSQQPSPANTYRQKTNSFKGAPEEDISCTYSKDRMTQFSCSRNLQLDPRDEKVRVKFQSSYFSQFAEQKFKSSIQPFEDELRDWLVDVIEIATSIGYNHLKKETLTEQETKSFVSKNVLQNIKEMFENYKELPLEIRYNLMQFINEQSFRIFDHIAKKYPQTRSKGVSKRIKSKVPVIDNRESNDFDFLLRNNIHIHYREDGDYSEDIMRIINKLITFSNEVYDPNMELEDSNYQVFSEILEFVFQNSIYMSSETIANQVARIINKKKNKIDQGLQNLIQNMSGIQMDNDDRSQFTRVKDFQKQVQIGQKIPIGVPLFSQEDIQASNFKICDSSILRLLTKWAEQLRKQIMNAEETIYRRRFKFKNNKGKRINLDQEMKNHLYKAAILEMKKVEEELKELKDQNFYLQTIFAEEENRGKYAKHDTKIGVYAAKLNQIASQYTFRYLNKLIHSLLTISKTAAGQAHSDREQTILDSVNLVTFKMGDMMRCKCSCSEQEFIKILKSIQAIHLHYPDILKMSRIKNRLETQNNDILINFFFGCKAECELQLSVLSAEKKQEKISSKFSHLIYEIVRAQLGPLSEMASIIVQYDPLAYFYSKKDKYSPELLIKNPQVTDQIKIQKSQQQRVELRKKMDLGTNIELPFVCSTCEKLSIVHNPQFYYRDFSKMNRVCNECLSNSFSFKNKDYQKLRSHVLDQNFQEDENMKIFFRKHVRLWSAEDFIEELKRESSDRVCTKWFPPKGYAIKYNKKKPKLQLFTCMFEPTYSQVLFANKNEKGEKNILFRINIHQEKQKKINNITKQLKKFAIYELYDTSEREQDGERYFVCDRSDCCGLRTNPSPILTMNEVENYVNEMMIKKPIQTQSSLLYLNYMPHSLDKLQKYLNKISEKNVLWKVRNTVQALEASKCDLSQIKIVGMFAKLSDLIIGGNQKIQSLQGIEGCTQLKYLNCNNCDLQHIQELTKLKKIQTLNLTNNRRLDSIQSLRQHFELQDLYLSHTAIRSLTPLERCLKLQSLDLQGCLNIRSIRQLKSTVLSYINIINCKGIECFDLPMNSIKNLRTVEMSSNKMDNVLVKFMSEVSQNLHQSKSKINRQNSEEFVSEEAIDKINKLLKIRRASSIILQI